MDPKPRSLEPSPERSPVVRVTGLPRATADRPSALTTAPDALGLLKALRRRWLLAIGLGLVVAIIAGVSAWLVVPPAKYQASSSIFIARNPRRIMFDPRDNVSDPQTYQKTQLALLTNQSVLAHALSKPEVAKLATIREKDDPDEWLGQSLKARFVAGSEVLEVALAGDRPEELAAIVDAVIGSYMELVVEAERLERLNRLDTLGKLWEKYQKDLEHKRKMLQDLSDTVGANDQEALAINQQFKVAELGVARAELLKVQSDLLRAQAGLEVLSKNATATAGSTPTLATGGPAVSDSAIAERVEKHPAVSGQRAQVDALAQQYRENKRLIRSSSDPVLVGVYRQWEHANRLLDEIRSKAQMEVRQQLMDAGRGIMAPAVDDGGLAKAHSEILALEHYRDSLTKGVENLQAEISKLNRGGMDLEEEREGIAIASEIARKVGSEVEAVRVEIAAPDRIRMLAKARVPKRRDEMKKIKVCGLAAAGCFGLMVLGVSFWEFQARRVESTGEVVDGLGMKLVGALPALPSRARTLMGRSDRLWQSLMVESIDATRTMLQHASRSEAVRTVMITSAVKGEGKTSLACHLAASLARAGSRTLLIDGDLRCPSVHRILDLFPGPGLAEALRGEATTDEIIQATVANGPDCIAAGVSDPLAMQALARGILDGLLNGLKRSYDIIIIDCAPALPVSDPLLISQVADCVLLSVMRGVSRLPQVYSVSERLESVGANVLGVVISGVRDPGHGGAGYYPYATSSAGR